MITNRDFKEYARQSRVRQKISLSELAERCEVRELVIDHFERGFNNPSLALAVRISKALGFELSTVIAIYETENVGNVPEIPFDDLGRG